MRHATVGRFQPPSVMGYLGQLYCVSGWSSLPWLHTLRQPTLVLAGDDDPIIPLVNARMMAWRITDARLYVVQGGGHLFFLERPGAMADVVASFLSESVTDVPLRGPAPEESVRGQAMGVAASAAWCSATKARNIG